MAECKEIGKAYMLADGELPPEEAATVIAHSAVCPDCAAALKTHGRVRNYFSQMRRACYPHGLSAAVVSAVRAAAEDEIVILWRAMVPAGALAFAALGCWLMVDSWTDTQPLSDMIVERGSAISEILGANDDPLRQLKLEEQDL